MSYDFAWHARHGELTDTSAKMILSILKRAFPIASVLDIGCGDGRWLRQALAQGAGTVAGVDGPWTDTTGLVIPAEHMTIADLSEPIHLGRRFDLAMSLEVGEHLPPENSQQMVRNLTAHSDLVLFGAAIPYQGGYRHINERWQSDWAALFADTNYQVFDLVRAAVWNNANVHLWYQQNALVYVNRQRQDLLDRIAAFMADEKIVPLPIDIVHPQKYLAIASYEEIAFKSLMRKLPGKTLGKIGNVLRGRI